MNRAKDKNSGTQSRYWNRNIQVKKEPLSSWNQRRQYMHRVFKMYKVGLLKETDLTEEEKRILVEYYGVEISH